MGGPQTRPAREMVKNLRAERFGGEDSLKNCPAEQFGAQPPRRGRRLVRRETDRRTAAAVRLFYVRSYRRFSAMTV